MSDIKVDICNNSKNLNMGQSFYFKFKIYDES